MQKKKKRGKALSKYGTIQRHRKSENSRNQLIVLFEIRIPNKKKNTINTIKTIGEKGLNNKVQIVNTYMDLVPNIGFVESLGR